jgi:hypothetical protein
VFEFKHRFQVVFLEPMHYGSKKTTWNLCLNLNTEMPFSKVLKLQIATPKVLGVEMV